MKIRHSALLVALGASALGASALGAQQPVPPPPAGIDSAALAKGLKFNYIVAVVDTHPITWYDVVEVINQRRAQGLQVPPDSASQIELARKVVNDLVDEEVLIARAKAEKVEVTDEEISQTVERQYKRIRDQFRTEPEFVAALRTEGFGTPDEYRKQLGEQARRAALQQRVIEKLRTDGKIVPVAVSEADVAKAFEENRATLPKRPATVTFRQIVVTPHASQAAKDRARAKAESLLAEIRGGSDFEQIAKRESADPASKDLGGDLGWNRRGVMAAEFDRWMFALAPGQLSPVVETPFGYHIIRVDRVQPAEVKARHILIRPVVDSADVARARAEADSVAAQWRAGVPYDSLVAKHHDPIEFKSFLDPFPREQLPKTYQDAFATGEAGKVLAPFAIDDPRTEHEKFVVAQLISVNEGGDYTATDLKLREQLGQERAIRRLIDQLRKDVYVSIRI